MLKKKSICFLHISEAYLLYSNFVTKNYEFLQTLLSVLFYYVKFNISFILIQDDLILNQDSPKSKYFINKIHLDAFNEILDFLRKILITKIII